MIWKVKGHNDILGEEWKSTAGNFHEHNYQDKKAVNLATQGWPVVADSNGCYPTKHYTQIMFGLKITAK